MCGRSDFRKGKKEEDPNIVVTWTSIRKRGIREERKIIGSFFLFNKKKYEERNVSGIFCLFFHFETKSNSLTTLNLSFLIL